MKLHIIVAVDTMGGFGKDGKIPWTLPEDMEHFKEITTGHVCAMGRRTYTDMLNMRLGSGKPAANFTLLPDRESYVITRDDTLSTFGSTRKNSLGEVFQKYQNTPRDIFIIGGYRMFIEALNYGPKIHMTIVKGDNYECDVHFPLQTLDNYKIINGRETEQCYYVEYVPA